MAGTPFNHFNEPETSAIIRKVKAGDGEGFATLYRRLAPALYAWARLRFRMSRSASVEPDDLVQEVWWRALERFETYDASRASFRSWLFGIANNVLLKGFRSLTHRATASIDPPCESSVQHGAGVADDATSVSRAVARDEALRACIARFLTLDETDLDVLIHCGLEGLSAPEASTLVGASPDATLKRWQRLRERLKSMAPIQGLVEEL